MKKMSVCLILLTSCVILHAQKTGSPSFRDYLRNKDRFITAKPPVLSFPGATNSYKHQIKDLSVLTGVRKATLAQVLSNGNKLYLLPQDNMVCVVPEMKQFNMPVIVGDNSIDKKMNAASPVLIIP